MSITKEIYKNKKNMVKFQYSLGEQKINKIGSTNDINIKIKDDKIRMLFD